VSLKKRKFEYTKKHQRCMHTEKDHRKTHRDGTIYKPWREGSEETNPDTFHVRISASTTMRRRTVVDEAPKP
jgi:hypothetical protein